MKIRSKDEIIEKLKKYSFKDELYHPLENCIDYHALLNQATAIPVFGTAQLLAWLKSELEDTGVEYISVTLTADETTLVVLAVLGQRKARVAIILQKVAQAIDPAPLLAKVVEAIRKDLLL